MKKTNLLILVCAVLTIVGCAKKEAQKQAQVAPAPVISQEIDYFRVECGLSGEEDQKRQGTQAVSLIVYGNPDLSNVDTTVSEAERTVVEQRVGDRKWSVYFDVNHDGDAIELSTIKSADGAIDGYRIVDKVKENGHYGENGNRVIEINGIAGCLQNAGGQALEAYAHILSERPAKQEDGSTKTVRGDKKDLKLANGCTCSFEMK